MQGKLSPWYIGWYDIIETINPIAYILDFPVELEHAHNVFHVSQLRKYILNLDHVLVTEPIEVIEDLTYEECLIQTLAHRDKQLHNKQLTLVKVLWANHTSSEAS